MSKKNKIEILTEDDDLAAIDNALDAAVDNLVGVNERIRELLETIEPPPPSKEGEGALTVASAEELLGATVGEEREDELTSQSGDA